MAKLLKVIYEIVEVFDDDYSDQRTKDQYLVRNPAVVVGTLFLYYKFVYDWGPKFMQDRKPFNLERVLLVYNSVQIIVCGYMFEKVIREVWLSGQYSMICQPLNFQDIPVERVVCHLIWCYTMTKYLDLLDTIFFVLRKKYNQITFLHVYHHIGMVVLSSASYKYLPGGQALMLGTINSFVHIVMYFYYLLSALNPVYKSSLWWKKYITQIQILQFLILMVHFGHTCFRPSCTYPKWVALVMVPQNFFMFALFSDFYYKAYIKKDRKKSEKNIPDDRKNQ